MRRECKPSHYIQSFKENRFSVTHFFFHARWEYPMVSLMRLHEWYELSHFQKTEKKTNNNNKPSDYMHICSSLNASLYTQNKHIGICIASFTTILKRLDISQLTTIVYNLLYYVYLEIVFFYFLFIYWIMMAHMHTHNRNIKRLWHSHTVSSHLSQTLITIYTTL